MEGSPTRIVRSRTAVALAVMYVISVLLFWVSGSIAYFRAFHGAAKFLGLAYVPSLFLPFVGRGTMWGIHVRSGIWLWWFALQLVLGGCAIWAYPYDRASLRVSRRRVSPPVPPRVTI